MKMDFEATFTQWLESCGAEAIPTTVQGFSFNLFEPAGETGVKFGIELVGADRFDEDDPDWACDEVWSPKARRLPIPVDYSGTTWDQCLQTMKTLVLKQLKADTPMARRLKMVQGIGIGFVDGDMEVIWKP
jgi:hypothetical protein